jgi:hypothetical protein
VRVEVILEAIKKQYGHTKKYLVDRHSIISSAILLLESIFI